MRRWFRNEKDVIAYAQASLLEIFPFAYGVLSKFDVVVVENDEAITYVEGNKIGISKRVFEENEDPTKFLVYLLAHTALHIAHLHFERDEEDPIFHIACDVVVENELPLEIDRPRIRFKGQDYEPIATWVAPSVVAVTDAMGRRIYIEDVNKKSAELIAEELRDQDYSPPLTPIIPIIVKGIDSKLATDALYYGYNLHKRLKGDLPAGLEELVRARMDVEVDIGWFIERFFRRVLRGRDEEDWSRPHFKSAIYGFFVPKTMGRKPPIGAIIVDTSGSVSKDDLSKFWGITRKIVAKWKLEVYFITCDAEVTDVEKLKDSLPEERVFKGRGGTDFRPAFEKAKELKAEFVIYLTDGFGDYPEREEIPTLWVLNTDYSPPFGEVVRL